MSWARATYVLEGRIVSVHSVPRLVSDGFRVHLQSEQGRRMYLWLNGTCESGSRRYGTCIKAEFPIGGRLRAQISDYAKPASCFVEGGNSFNFECGRWKWGRSMTTQRILSLEVDGHPVASGWSFRSFYLMPMLWIAALAITLIWHDWRLAAVPVRTWLALAVFFLPLGIPVAAGLWNQLL